jgi:hypothetical protein
MGLAELSPQDVPHLAVCISGGDGDTARGNPPTDETGSDPVLTTTETTRNGDKWMLEDCLRDVGLDGPRPFVEDVVDEADRILDVVAIALSPLPRPQAAS